MNAPTEKVVSFERRKETRRRIARPMRDFVDGLKSVNALAQAMDKFNSETTGEGAVKITSADMPRASGTFGTLISETKMTAVIKFLSKKRGGAEPQSFKQSDIKTNDDFFRFVDGLNYVEAARQASSNPSRSAFAEEIGATEEEVLDAEKGRLVRFELLVPFKKAIKQYGAHLKQING